MMTRTVHHGGRAGLLGRLAAAAVLCGGACSMPPAAQPGPGSPADGAAMQRPGDTPLERLPATPWRSLRPGDVIVAGGERPLAQALHVRHARGTAERPIVIRAAAGVPAVFLSSIVVEESAHLVLEGLTVRGSRFPGIAIKKGSHHVTVRDCTVSENALGVWITDGAGCGHRIVGNEIAANATHGIAIDAVNCQPAEETLLGDNRVHGNGHHGIEIHGNGYLVEGNEVFRNGDRAPGTSGIHVFSRSEQEDTGDHNAIRFNVVYENKEARGPDGNGIQLDQWCDDNVVAYNVVFSNDGAGIIAFDSARDRIYNNTVFGNMLDPDGKHPFKGEIVLATDADRRINRVDQVVVTNNIVVANRRGALCIVVDRFTAGKTLDIGNNVFFHKAGGDVFAWGDVVGADPARWGSLNRSRMPDVFADPMIEKDAPARIDDFRPRRGSIAIGRSVRLDQRRDAAGKEIPASKQPDLGALEWGPR